MKKITLLLALSSSFLATSAWARDDSFYIELDGGVVFADTFKLREADTTDPLRFRLKPDTGYDFGGIVGYDFGGFRIETEASYRSVGNKDFRIRDSEVGVFDGDSLHGHSSALSFMGNALLDFGKDDGLQFYAGGGAGIAKVDQKISVEDISGSEVLVNGDDWDFAWQALAGFRVPIGQTVDIGVKYRYFNVPSYRIDTDDFGYKGKWASHSVLATLTFNLGAKSEPAPPPPPPPPPPP
ncbi:outer membrane protein, partial [Novosphingobium clariflavum]